jgi:hypothetical protein
MILYEEAGAPSVRAGESDLGGRRVAVRGFAYVGDIGPPAFRFDPIGRRLVARRPAGTVLAGPFAAAPWTAAFAKAPAGPALVEGGTRGVEDVRGAYRAAVEGVLAAGRGAYLLDPPVSALPEEFAPPVSGVPPPAVVLFSWSPGRDVDGEGLSAARSRGIPAGVVWPVLPGWTDEDSFTIPFLEAASRAGAVFALPLPPATDGELRKAAVDARAHVEPAAAEAFFDTMFHSPWEDSLPDALARARRTGAAAGLAALPPRPGSRREPAGNVGAASRLEERAVRAEDEHRASRLHAAARWIDVCERDLAPILREGNFARAFPFGPELAREAEEALREALG